MIPRKVPDMESRKPLCDEPDACPSSGCADKSSFVRNDTDKAEGSRFSLACAFACAWRGLAHAVRTQRNMKIHLVASAAAIAFGFALSLDYAGWVAVVLCIALVFSMECMNTAVESLVDLVSPDYHELARRAKDCAASAVLVASLAALVVAGIVFLPRLIALIVG